MGLGIFKPDNIVIHTGIKEFQVHCMQYYVLLHYPFINCYTVHIQMFYDYNKLF